MDSDTSIDISVDVSPTVITTPLLDAASQQDETFEELFETPEAIEEAKEIIEKIQILQEVQQKKENLFNAAPALVLESVPTILPQTGVVE